MKQRSNSELKRIGLDPLPAERAFDTLTYARRKHPGASNSLDALCARYKIDNSRRTKHGALLDAEILAEVYIELRGGRQTHLGLSVEQTPQEKSVANFTQRNATRPIALPDRLTPAELDAHAAFVATLSADALWKEYMREQKERD